ncbi:hypothetical protein AF63_09010 [Streptococcus uberis Ab71]|nr:hypothetical protein AF63_09010 [Streptococcus uberis Ab71]
MFGKEYLIKMKVTDTSLIIVTETIVKHEFILSKMENYLLSQKAKLHGLIVDTLIREKPQMMKPIDIFITIFQHLTLTE